MFLTGRNRVYRQTLNSHAYFFDNWGNTFYYSITKSSLDLELSYRFLPKLTIYLQSGWTRDYLRKREEFHVTYVDDFYDDYSTGSDETRSLSTVKVIAGTRLYFSKYGIKRVQPFIIAEIGKQFAWALDKYEDLYPPEEPPYGSDDNYKEYLEEQNSPIFGVFGLGVEYYFNESLSTYTNVRFIYEETHYSLWEESHSENYSDTERTKEYWDIEVNTRVGFGLRFYF